jgi:hypothetical protein
MPQSLFAALANDTHERAMPNVKRVKRSERYSLAGRYNGTAIVTGCTSISTSSTV